MQLVKIIYLLAFNPKTHILTHILKKDKEIKMSQVTIYINNDLEQQVKKLASSLNLSISKFISNTLEQKINNEWDSNIKHLSGSWSDFPDLNEIRVDKTEDIKREEF